MIYCIVHGLNALEFSDYFTFGSSIIRRHPLKLTKQASRVNSHAFSFANRSIDVCEEFDVISSRRCCLRFSMYLSRESIFSNSLACIAAQLILILIAFRSNTGRLADTVDGCAVNLNNEVLATDFCVALACVCCGPEGVISSCRCCSRFSMYLLREIYSDINYS